MRGKEVTGMGNAVASPWRRIAAWGLDYVVIAAYLILLTAVTLGLLASPVGPGFGNAMRQPVTAELIGVLLLTAPVVLYFALMEASAGQATLGKRTLGIFVVGPGDIRLSIGRALAREGARFLPWELSHALIWRLALHPHGTATQSLAIGGLAIVYSLVFAYLISLFVGSQHLTLYDRLAGSRVVRRK